MINSVVVLLNDWEEEVDGAAESTGRQLSSSVLSLRSASCSWIVRYGISN